MGADFMKAEELYISERQIEIIKRHASGQTEKVIALDLGIGMSTVKYHKRTLFKSINVESTPEAICKLKDIGLI